MTGMLASVSSVQEARQVLAAGADIIDLKAPASGALGALDKGQVRAVVSAVGGRCPLSATVGDLPMQPKTVLSAVRAMAATAVDYVKVGFFPGGDWAGVLNVLQGAARNGVRLVAVFFADRPFDLQVIARLEGVGFHGAMLDTMDKGGGSLRSVCPEAILEAFVAEVKSRGLLCGLAGSLQQQDIAPLLKMEPDYLGFRGALCHRQRRTDAIDPEALRQVRAAIPRNASAVLQEVAAPASNPVL